jgi:hypothetical protein
MPASTLNIPETVTVSSADLIGTVALVHAFEIALAESVGRAADDFDQFLVGCGCDGLERSAFGVDVLDDAAGTAVDEAIQEHVRTLLVRLRELTGGPADSVDVRLRELAENVLGVRWDPARGYWAEWKRDADGDEA